MEERQMADIFSRVGQTFNGAFSADSARLTFAGGSDILGAGGDSGGIGLLTQTLQFSYAQAVTRLYEVGSNKTYLVAGRAQGQIGLGRVLGPRPVQVAFYQKYGNVCNAATNNIEFLADTGCGADQENLSGGTFAFTIKHAVITQISISVAAQDMIVNEQLQMLFISLQLGASATFV
jgi:hypothetical protein